MKSDESDVEFPTAHTMDEGGDGAHLAGSVGVEGADRLDDDMAEVEACN